MSGMNDISRPRRACNLGFELSLMSRDPVKSGTHFGQKRLLNELMHTTAASPHANLRKADIRLAKHIKIKTLSSSVNVPRGRC